MLVFLRNLLVCQQHFRELLVDFLKAHDISVALFDHLNDDLESCFVVVGLEPDVVGEYAQICERADDRERLQLRLGLLDGRLGAAQDAWDGWLEHLRLESLLELPKLVVVFHVELLAEDCLLFYKIERQRMLRSLVVVHVPVLEDARLHEFNDTRTSRRLNEALDLVQAHVRSTIAIE